MQIKTFSNTNINFQKYSPEVVKMLETRVESLYAKNLSPKEIAKMLDTTEAFVRKSLQKLHSIERTQKLQEFNAKRLEKKDDKINKRLSLGLEILKLKKQGLTLKEIAQKLKCTQATIRGALEFYEKRNLDLLV